MEIIGLTIVNRDRIAVLERELELLQAQNAVLRRDGRQDEGSRKLPLYGNEDSAAPEEKEKERGSETGGRTIGTLPQELRIEGSSSVAGDVRSQMHAKWEAEKRLQKR